MKKYNALYATLLIITAVFFPALGMEKEEMDLTQSTIGAPKESTQQPNLFNAFFNKQIEQNYKKQKNTIAKKQREKHKISLDEWKEYQTALNDYNNSIAKNNPIKADIQKKLENLTKNNQRRELKAELAAFKAQSKEDRNIQDLQKYKKNLQAYLAHLPNPTPETQEQYQEIIKHIDLINKIDEQVQVDYTNFTINELYKHFKSLNKLRKQLHDFDSERYQKLDTKIAEVISYYNEKVKERREQQLLEQRRAAKLADELTEQALNQELDRLVKEAEKDLNKQAQAKRKEMQQQQRLEQEKQRHIDELERAEKEKQQREVLQKKLARQKQEKLDQENQRKIDEAMKQEEERHERERLAQLERARLEEEEKANQSRLTQEKLEKERLEQENAKCWIPVWITNSLSQTRQIVANFVENITSTITSWWWWLTRR